MSYVKNTILINKDEYTNGYINMVSYYTNKLEWENELNQNIKLLLDENSFLEENVFGIRLYVSRSKRKFSGKFNKWLDISVTICNKGQIMSLTNINILKLSIYKDNDDYFYTEYVNAHSTKEKFYYKSDNEDSLKELVNHLMINVIKHYKKLYDIDINMRKELIDKLKLNG